VVWAVVSEPKLRLLLGDFARDVSLLVLIAMAAWAVGERLGRWLKEESSGLEGALISLGLGAGAYAVAIFVVGILGILYSWMLLALIVLGLIAGVKRFSILVGDFKSYLEQDDIEATFSPARIVLAIVALIVGMMVFMSVLMPEIFYDALYYHDAFGALYLIRHRIEVYPFAVHSAMPSYVNLLYVPLLAFGDAETVKLGHFAFGLGSCLWIYAMGARWFGDNAGLCGAVLFASLPGVGIMAGLGAVDLGICFFALGSLVLLARWIFEREGRGVLLASAIFLGVAVGSKYSALAVGVVAAVGVAAGTMERGKYTKEALYDVLLFGGISLAVAAPWFLRNLIVLHNPIYPALEPEGSAGYFAYWNLKHDSAKLYSWVETFWKLPGDVVFRKGAFGAGADISPGIFLLFAGLVWGIFQKGFSRWAVVGVLILYILWARSLLIVRYFYPGLGIAAVLCGGMLLREGRRRTTAAVAVIAVLAISLIGLRNLVRFHESYYRGAFQYLSSSMPSDKYLARFTPHSAIAKWIGKNTPYYSTKLLLVGETKGYYFGRNYEPISAYDRHPLVSWIKETKTAESLKNLLRREGFTHIVWRRSEFERLNKSYRHCKLSGEEMRVYEEFLGKCRLILEGKGMEVYALE